MHLHKFMNKTAVVAPTEPRIIRALNAIGIDTVCTKPIDALIQLYEQYHADMQLLLIGSTAFVAGNATYLKDELESFGYDVLVCECLEGKYPSNVLLNAALVGDKLICKEDSLSERVKEYCEEQKIKIFNVKQGYAKCSTLVLKDRAIITADINIHTVASNNDIDSLLISPGYIELSGADYGFIGGSSAVVGDTVVFFGDINTHPDCSNIVSFIEKHNIKHISLIDGMLTDIGGMVMLN